MNRAKGAWGIIGEPRSDRAVKGLGADAFGAVAAG
jgi:hypothetical protein